MVSYDLSPKRLIVRYVLFAAVLIVSSITFSGMDMYYI